MRLYVISVLLSVALPIATQDDKRAQMTAQVSLPACSAPDPITATARSIKTEGEPYLSRYAQAEFLLRYDLSSPTKSCAIDVATFSPSERLVLTREGNLAQLESEGVSYINLETLDQVRAAHPDWNLKYIFQNDPCETRLKDVVQTAKIAWGKGCAILRSVGRRQVLHLRFFDQTDADMLATEPLTLQAGRTYTGVSSGIWNHHLAIAGQIALISKADDGSGVRIEELQIIGR